MGGSFWIGRPLVVAAVLASLAACAQQGGAPPAARPVATADPIIGTPAPGSKFSRLSIGMSSKEVQDLIGPPTDTDSHITGKSFIPFYFGGDTSRVEAHYRGEGVLTFSPRSFGSGSLALIAMRVNPSEPGYVK